MAPSDGPKKVKSVENAFTILDELRKTGGLRLTELSERVGMTPGSLHTQLSTLRSLNLVVQEGKVYKLGPETLLFGENFKNRHPLVRAGKRLVDELAVETKEVANLHIEHAGRLYKLYERFGGNATGKSFFLDKRAESPQYLHCTAAGKPILANLPEERIQRLVTDLNLTKHTENTITDPETLCEELERVRERGYALDREELLNSLRAVGAPIFDENQSVVGTVTIVGPSARLRGDYFDEELPNQVTSVADTIEINMQTGDTEL